MSRTLQLQDYFSSSFFKRLLRLLTLASEIIHKSTSCTVLFSLSLWFRLFSPQPKCFVEKPPAVRFSQNPPDSLPGEQRLPRVLTLFVVLAGCWCSYYSSFGLGMPPCPEAVVASSQCYSRKHCMGQCGRCGLPRRETSVTAVQLYSRLLPTLEFCCNFLCFAMKWKWFCSVVKLYFWNRRKKGKKKIQPRKERSVDIPCSATSGLPLPEAARKNTTYAAHLRERAMGPLRRVSICFIFLLWILK